MLGSEVTSKGQQGPCLEGRGLPALREHSKRVACNRGVGHPRCVAPLRPPATTMAGVAAGDTASCSLAAASQGYTPPFPPSPMATMGVSADQC